jgi:hypothetical protein
MPPLARVIDPLHLLEPARRLAGTAASAAAAEGARGALALVERALESPRTVELVDHVLDSPRTAELVDHVLDSPRTAALVERVLDSAGMERLVAQVLDSRLLDASVARVLANENLWLVVEEIAQSPAVTDAIAHQGAGFADQVAGEVGRRTRRVDARLDRAARRLLRRHPPPDADVGGDAFPAPQPP